MFLSTCLLEGFYLPQGFFLLLFFGGGGGGGVVCVFELVEKPVGGHCVLSL